MARVVRRFALVQFAAFVVVLGVPDGALGVLWPAMRHTFGRPVGDLGYVAVAGTLLYLIGGVVFAALASRVRAGRLIVWSCGSSAIAAAAWAVAGAWGLALAAVACFGLGRGVLDAAVNATAADDIRRLGWMHAGWAVGGAAGPALVAGLAATGSWRAAVGVLAAGSAVVTAVAVLARAGWPPARPPATLAAPALARLRRHGWAPITVVLVTFGAYTAAEIGPVAWGYVYLTDHRGLGRGAAAAAVASFWVALTVGRVAVGAVGDRVDAHRVLDASCVLLAGALAVFWTAPTAVAVAALPVAGLASAAVFPILVMLTPSVVGVEAGDEAVGLAIAAAAIGGPLAVLVEGQLANAAGTGVLGAALFVAAVLLLVVIVSCRNVLRRGTDSQPVAAPTPAHNRDA